MESNNKDSTQIVEQPTNTTTDTKQATPANKKPVETCKHFVESKKRMCKFARYKDSEYCCHHIGLQGDYFVPCPIDPTHTVLKDNLEKHKSICPRVKERQNLEKQVWFKEDVNIPKKIKKDPADGPEVKQAFDAENEQEQEKTGKFIAIYQKEQPEKFNKLLEKITQCFEQVCDLYLSEIKEDLKTNPSLTDYQPDYEYFLNIADVAKLVTTKKGNNASNMQEESKESTEANISDTQKNFNQCELLVKMLERHGLLGKKDIYIEFGAGKGSLSHHISEANENQSGHLLIELESRRFKCDRNHREGGTFYRIRTDIKNVDVNTLPKIEAFKSYFTETENKSETKVVGVSKHMCGVATDLSLYFMMNGREDGPVKSNGLMIATCCHHRCVSDLTVGYEFLTKLGISEDEFGIMKRLSSWGTDLSRIFKTEGEDQEVVNESLKKRKIGQMVKRIVDLSRVMQLRKDGYKAYLIKYCSCFDSPENFVIIAKK